MSKTTHHRLSEDVQRQAEHTHTHKAPSVLIYLVILFLVAFLLLFIAYFQQQRVNDEAQADALKQSVSAVQSIQNLIQDSNELRDERDALQKKVDELEDQLKTANEQASLSAATVEEQQNALAAMEYFWQIDEAYVRSRYTTCRELIAALEEAGLDTALPDWKATDTDRPSPAERYAAIKEAVN